MSKVVYIIIYYAMLRLLCNTTEWRVAFGYSKFNENLIDVHIQVYSNIGAFEMIQLYWGIFQQIF